MFIVEINQIIGAKPLRISVNKSENQLQQQWRVQKWATTTTTIIQLQCICEFELGLREREREKCSSSTRTHTLTYALAVWMQVKLYCALPLSCSLRQLIAAAAIVCSPLSSSHQLQRCQLGGISLLTWNFMHFTFNLILLLQKEEAQQNYTNYNMHTTASRLCVCLYFFFRVLADFTDFFQWHNNCCYLWLFIVPQHIIILY